MKILQINKFFFLKGGAEKYFFDLSELLERKGHKVLIFSTKHPKNFKWSKKNNFVDYYDLSKKEDIFTDLRKAGRIFWNFEAKNKINNIIEASKPDIAHLHNIFHHFSPSIISALKKAGIPIVLTLHDYKLFCPNYKFYSQDKICYDCLKKKNYTSCLSKKCVKNSRLKSLLCAWESQWQKHLKVADQIDAFIAPSTFMKNKALAFGIDKSKVFHLPYFIDNKKNLVSDKSDKTQKDNPYLLYFGRLSDEKGVDILIRAFSRISKNRSKWKLKIAGVGPAKKELKEIAKDCRQIEFVGKKKGQELSQLIDKSSFTVLAPLWPENFPYSVLESFMAKKLVISTQVGGLVEMIEHEQTGLLVKPNNTNDLARKIEWAMANPQKISKMGKAAQIKAVVVCSAENHYKHLIKIYEKIQNN